MDGERKLTDAGRHNHGACMPCSAPVEGVPCMGMLPVRCIPANSRTSTTAPIPNAFTQPGVLGGTSGSSSAVLGGDVMSSRPYSDPDGAGSVRCHRLA